MASTMPTETAKLHQHTSPALCLLAGLDQWLTTCCFDSMSCHLVAGPTVSLTAAGVTVLLCNTKFGGMLCALLLSLRVIGVRLLELRKLLVLSLLGFACVFTCHDIAHIGGAGCV